MTSAFEHRVTRAPDGSFYVSAPAKINIFLHITGRRDDGYHVLESLFVFSKRGDLVRVRASEGFELEITGACASQLAHEDKSDNLVGKAARALARHAGINPKASIELEKNLPVAAGLGGGSADAAACMIGLNCLWNLGYSEETLADIALELGADVPACLWSKPQIVRGVGEKLSVADPGWSAGVVLVNPRKGLATPDVFAGFRAFREKRGLPPFDVPISDLRRVISDISMLDVLTANSLQDAASQLCPEIMEVERYLRLNSQHELLRMSGSGATVFALYHDKQAAEAVARRVREHHPAWWVMADEIGD